MSNADLKREPHYITEDCWWYEEAKGIEIVMRVYPSVTYVRTIPWRSIRAALARKDKVKK